MKNLEKYKADLNQLIETGDQLLLAIRYACYKEQVTRSAKRQFGEEAAEFLNTLPEFSKEYQAWYSEATTLIRQLLPDRLDDFCSYYEMPKGRKDINHASYRISDYLVNLGVTRGAVQQEVIVGPKSAIPRFEQQLAIVKAIEKRFKSSLFDIRQLVQADLFDSELEAARALVKNGFHRSGGALAGVVMEKHLAQVCEQHGIKFDKRKKPTIAVLNGALKDAGVIDIPRWRSNQYLGDIRNLCDHHKDREPTSDEVTELVDGVGRVTKTLF